MDQDWPFADPKNLAVFTVRQIMRNGKPILRVSHDDDDGAWQFLQWGTPEKRDAMIVTLEEIVQNDSTICEPADLPLGWRAWRRNMDDMWQREPISSSDG
ncbi:MAG: hypothetical protein EHM48_06260 [Planctomycetaceae bacterium]|nr:MAG: hypothetical protein EHM48_06260 [Planctomycetaceae bacterium]